MYYIYMTSVASYKILYPEMLDIDFLDTATAGVQTHVSADSFALVSESNSDTASILLKNNGVAACARMDPRSSPKL